MYFVHIVDSTVVQSLLSQTERLHVRFIIFILLNYCFCEYILCDQAHVFLNDVSDLSFVFS